MSPLDPAVVWAGVGAGSGLWSDVSAVAETGSTNEDLLAAARAGAREGAVLVAERQVKGRGRLGRQWISKPGGSLTFSVLLRPAAVPPAARGWLPLLTGVAVAAAIQVQAGVEVGLKWPNDVLSPPGEAGGMAKVAGILAEQAGDAIVVGTGLNVLGRRAELPAGATSLAEMGGDDVGRADLLVAILRELEQRYLSWIGTVPPGDAVSSGLRADYQRACYTIGRDVRVELPGGSILVGIASDIDGVGRLVVTGPGGAEPVSAGDVIHVR